MRILALDLSTHTGWCVGDSADRPTYGTKHLKTHGESIGPLAVEFHRWLRRLVEDEKPELIAFEAPILAKRTKLHIIRMLTGLAYHTEFMAEYLDVRCREVDLWTIKRFWTGNAKAEKIDMVRAAQMYGYDPQDDNAADAIALWEYSVHRSTADGKLRMGALGARAKA